MAKKDIDRRVTEAIHALTAGKESSIRDLVSSLDDISKLDARLRDLFERRSALLESMEKQTETARVAGWKVKDLADAGLAVPRALSTTGLTATSAGTGLDDQEASAGVVTGTGDETTSGDSA